MPKDENALWDALTALDGTAQASLFAHCAKEAERLLDGSGWLPEPLRLDDVGSEPAESQGEAGPLPEFLSENEEQETAPDEVRPQQLDAAE